jgi:hypothetical protein
MFADDKTPAPAAAPAAPAAAAPAPAPAPAPLPPAVVPDHAPDHTFECGGCGASAKDSFPPCITGKAPHQVPPAKGFPHPDWVVHNVGHPTGAHDTFLAGLGDELGVFLDKIGMAVPARITAIVPTLKAAAAALSAARALAEMHAVRRGHQSAVRDRVLPGVRDGV